MNRSDAEKAILSLIESDAVTPQTRAALAARLNHAPVSAPKVFTVRQFRTLYAVCKRLVPQPDSQEMHVDLPGLLDEKVNSSNSKGWRYDSLKSEIETFTQGMEGVGESAQTLYGKAFSELDHDSQDGILKAVQDGLAIGNTWCKLPAARFFEELLVALSELYYSHPIAKASIGDVSFADAHGWQAIGLNEREEAHSKTNDPHS